MGEPTGDMRDRPEAAARALNECASAFIDCTIHAQDAIALTRYVLALEAALRVRSAGMQPAHGGLRERILALSCRVPNEVFTHDRNNGATAYQRGFRNACRAAAEMVDAFPEGQQCVSGTPKLHGCTYPNCAGEPKDDGRGCCACPTGVPAVSPAPSAADEQLRRAGDRSSRLSELELGYLVVQGRDGCGRTSGAPSVAEASETHNKGGA